MTKNELETLRDIVEGILGHSIDEQQVKGIVAAFVVLKGAGHPGLIELEKEFANDLFEVSASVTYSSSLSPESSKQKYIDNLEYWHRKKRNIKRAVKWLIKASLNIKGI
jgi:hypothetical protein